MSFKVDFIGIGAPKSGTTWISQCLDEHPNICHAKKNGEIHETVFFENVQSYRKGIGFYETFFKHCSPRVLKGEITPTYLYSSETAGRIKKHNPEVKLLVCLRNPIERAYSHYTAHERNGKNVAHNINSFDEIVHKHDNPYFTRGFYSEHIESYLRLFGKENMLVLIYDDIAKNQTAFVQSIYSFLGVNNMFVPPSLLKKINATEEHSVYSKTINQWLLYGKLGAKLSKFPGYKPVRRFLKKTGLFIYSRKIIGGINVKQRPWKREPMSEKSRVFLQEAYQKDITKLEKLLDRKLDFWK